MKSRIACCFSVSMRRVYTERMYGSQAGIFECLWRRVKDERGVALILTLLILSFLAALGAALLASTTMDVWLVDNYRTRILALHLAESGMEQARDVLRTTGPTNAQPFLA